MYVGTVNYTEEISVGVLLAMAEQVTGQYRVRHVPGEEDPQEQATPRPGGLRGRDARQSAEEPRQQMGLHHGPGRKAGERRKCKGRTV